MDWGYKAGVILKNKAFLEVKLEPFFVLVSKGCFVINQTKNFPATARSYKWSMSFTFFKT